MGVPLRDYRQNEGFLIGPDANPPRGTKEDIAYQSKLQADLLEHKVHTVQKADGSDLIVTQVRVTPKGLARLAKELKI